MAGPRLRRVPHTHIVGLLLLGVTQLAVVILPPVAASLERMPDKAVEDLEAQWHEPDEDDPVFTPPPPMEVPPPLPDGSIDMAAFNKAKRKSEAHKPKMTFVTFGSKSRAENERHSQ